MEAKKVEQQLFSLINEGCYEEAQDLCTQALVSEAKNDSLQKTNVSLLIHLDKFKEALKLIKEYGLSKDLAFEHAYCYYRLGLYPKCISIIDQEQGANGSHHAVGWATLRAQALYNAKQYCKATKEYETLISTNSKDDSDRLQVNLLASQTCLLLETGKTDDDQVLSNNSKEETNFETKFNASCFYALCSRYEKAYEQINSALTLATDSLNEGGEEMMMNDSDDDKSTKGLELCPYYIQRAFIASKLYSPKLKDQITKDLNTAAKVSLGVDTTIGRIAQLNMSIAKNGSCCYSSDEISKMLKEKRFGPTQKPHVLFLLALTEYKKKKPDYEVCAKILRKVVRFSPTRPIATALLFRVLEQLHAKGEIKKRSTCCRYMRAIVRAQKFLIKDNEFVEPGLLGLLLSKTGTINDNKHYIKAHQDDSEILLAKTMAEYLSKDPKVSHEQLVKIKGNTSQSLMGTLEKIDANIRLLQSFT